MSAIGRDATPLSIAARATAGATRVISRGSKGFGIRYSGPKLRLVIPYADATTSLCSSCARPAMACTAATSICVVIVVAPTSSAPRKMNGKHRTLFTWFG